MSRVKLAGVVAVIAVAACVALVVVARPHRVSSLEPPGAVERFVAERWKSWAVSRGARAVSVPTAADVEESVRAGRELFRRNCAFCHGFEGRRSPEVGFTMFPRAPALSARAIQARSDAELFWIVANGIRRTGMPGFGPILAEDEIADVVRYVRTLGTAPVE